MDDERLIYFDNMNTTFPASEVIAAVTDALSSKAGNPSSHIHSAGIAAGRLLDEARNDVASLIKAKPQNIVFTSGATESNNLAISGFLAANQACQLAVSSIEHFSIINQLRKLRQRGIKASVIEVDNSGIVNLAQLEDVLNQGRALVSIAMANPEIGTVQDVEAIGRICRKYDSVFHCDATGAAGLLDIDVDKLGVDLLTLSGHNMYGPMGIGALFAGERVNLDSLMDGGNQELGIRPGTENLPGAAGLGEACELAMRNQVFWREQLLSLGQRLWKGMAGKVPFIHFTGHPEKRLPGHVSFWIEHVEGESLLLLLNMKGVMAASGSACSSNLKGKDEDDLVASHVLAAVGVPTDICAGSITFSLARYNTVEEVDYVIAAMPGIVERLLAMSPSYDDYKRKKGVVT